MTLTDRLLDVYSHLRRELWAALEEFGLSPLRYFVLRTIAARPDVSVGEVARCCRVSRQTLNFLLNNMERDGLISRTTARGRGRPRPVQLDPFGESLLESSRDAIESVENLLLSGLTVTEVDALQEHLETCTRMLACAHRQREIERRYRYPDDLL